MNVKNRINKARQPKTLNQILGQVVLYGIFPDNKIHRLRNNTAQPRLQKPFGSRVDRCECV